MKSVWLAALAVIMIVGAPEVSFAQKKDPKAGMTCAQRCSKFCEGKIANCFDRCTTLKCR